MGFKKALGKQSSKGSGMSLNNGLVKVQVGFKQWFGQWLGKDLGMFRKGFGHGFKQHLAKHLSKGLERFVLEFRQGFGQGFRQASGRVHTMIKGLCKCSGQGLQFEFAGCRV